MFIKRVLVTNFKSDELRILNVLMQTNASDSPIEVGNIRQTSKINIISSILSKIELLPRGIKFHAPIVMKGKYYCRIMGFIIDKNNFIAITIGHQAMIPSGELKLTGESQLVNLHVVAESEDKLRDLCNVCHLHSFTDYLIKMQNNWNMDFNRQIKVNLGVAA